MRKALVNRLDGDPVEIEGNGGMRVSPAGRGRDPKVTGIIRVPSASFESRQLCRYRADSRGTCNPPPEISGMARTPFAHCLAAGLGRASSRRISSPASTPDSIRPTCVGGTDAISLALSS
jgi:hypothetical protein